jgi:hypothetical protein
MQGLIENRLAAWFESVAAVQHRPHMHRIAPTPEDRLRDMLRHFPTLLARWSGAMARMTELTESHAALVIDLRFPDRQGHLRVACIDPSFIHGPIHWENALLTVDLLPSLDLQVRDVRADLCITTGKVEIAEFSSDPWQPPPTGNNARR